MIGGFYRTTYRVELRDHALHYTTQKGWNPKPIASATIKPTSRQWNEFRQSLDHLGVWRWHPDYSTHVIKDPTVWYLDLAYLDHTLESKGGPENPKYFDGYIAAVQKLLGGKPFK